MSRQDRWIIASTLIVMIAVVVWQVLRESAEQSRDPLLPPMSSVSALPQGSKALYLALEQSGRSPIRWGRSFAQLRNRSGTLVTFGVDGLETEATIQPDAGEIESVKHWVADGNTIVAFGSHVKVIFPDLEQKSTKAEGTGAGEWQGLNFKGFKSVFAKIKPSDTTLIATEDGALAIERSVGDGKAILVADSSIMSNGIIGLADNAAILSAIPKGKSTFLDDFHRGHVTGGSAMEMLPDHFRSALLLALLVSGLFIARSAIRFGPIEEEPTREQRSGAEIAWSLSRLLKHAGAVPAAARELVRSYKTEVGITQSDRLETALDRLADEPDNIRLKLRELESAIENNSMQADSLTALSKALAEVRSLLRNESSGRFINK